MWHLHRLGSAAAPPHGVQLYGYYRDVNLRNINFLKNVPPGVAPRYPDRCTAQSAPRAMMPNDMPAKSTNG
ncbi:MAG: hypothetical protein QFF03_05555, partial [Pseudomonadota bacterium]|nr:hypothetical protein [Pseudomonadota bacterium]